MPKIMKFDQFITSITILIDDREKVNYWITDSFKKAKIPMKTQRLKYGDYWCVLDDELLDCYIERKNSLTELTKSLINETEKSKFYLEFERMGEGEKHLIIENDSIDNILSHTYGGDFGEMSYLANFLLLRQRYEVIIDFVNKYNMAFYMLKVFYYNYYYMMKG